MLPKRECQKEVDNRRAALKNQIAQEEARMKVRSKIQIEPDFSEPARPIAC
jgi:hypothetical protein